MGAAIEELLSLTNDDALNVDLAELQLRAASERLQTQRDSLPALDRRATEVGVDKIATQDDLIPLLFAHSIYKSYPESLVTKGQWGRLSQWISTISATDAGDVDVSEASDIDEWMGCLADAGIFLTASSGTSGKMSFLPMSQQDLEAVRSLNVKAFGDRHSLDATKKVPFTFLGPGTAPMQFSWTYRFFSEAFGRPGATRCLIEQPLKLNDTLATAALTRRMKEGTATPDEVAAFENATRARVSRMSGVLESLTDEVLGYRDEPQLLFGPASMVWQLVEQSRAKGIPDGTFHPDSIVMAAGGKKGSSIPDDYEAQMADFFGPVDFVKGYGMSEVSTGFSMCEAGVYHNDVPHIVFLVLDESGEKLLTPEGDGRVTGRFAAYDALFSSRWGGIVTGDRVTADFSLTCECGRPGPTIEDSIIRYSDLNPTGDDKLTCGGTIEEYVRGAVEE